MSKDEKTRKQRFKNLLGLLKWVFAIGLVYALVRSGRLSPSDIKNFLSHPDAAAKAFGLGFILLILAQVRWWRLLVGAGIDLPFWDSLRLGMLGQFFNVVLPGSVSGDLVKGVYVAKRFPQRKMAAVTTIFLDRLIGLGAMLVLSGAAYLVGRSLLQGGDATLVHALGGVATAGALAVMGSLTLYSLMARRLPVRAPSWLARLPLAKAWNDLYAAALQYRDRPSALWMALGLSVGMHAVNVFILHTIASAMFGPPPWGSIEFPLFAMAAVLGLSSQALPIAPAGVGVGQVAFAAIFVAIGAPSQAFGAGIVTGLQLVTITLNLLGVFFFATYRQSVEKGDNGGPATVGA